MARARTDTAQLAELITDRIAQFRPVCVPVDHVGWFEIETFVQVALRVFAQTNPSKIRDAMMIEEMKARLDGRGMTG